MQLLAGFVALVAVAQSALAVPFRAAETSLAPVPVTHLVCDGDTYQCTANLKFGDGRWVAQWSTAVFHTGLFGAPDHKDMHEMAMAPVPVTSVDCDGNTYKCTAHLQFGDNRWVAQWSTAVYHNGLLAGDASDMAPVPVTQMTCDGDSYKCIANLQFGDGRWVAEWDTKVFHSARFHEQ